DSLVRFQFDNELAGCECVAGLTVPFEHANLFHIFDGPGHNQFVVHAFPFWVWRREDRSSRMAASMRRSSGMLAASSTGFEEIGTGNAPTRATRTVPSFS